MKKISNHLTFIWNWLAHWLMASSPKMIKSQPHWFFYFAHNFRDANGARYLTYLTVSGCWGIVWDHLTSTPVISRPRLFKWLGRACLCRVSLFSDCFSISRWFFFLMRKFSSWKHYPRGSIMARSKFLLWFFVQF